MKFSFLNSDCSIQTDQVVIEKNHQKTIIHLNDLIIDVQKGTEVTSSTVNTNGTQDEQIQRTFK